MKKENDNDIVCSLGKEYDDSRLISQLMEAYRTRQCYTCYKYFPNCSLYYDFVDEVIANVKEGKKDLPALCPKYENKFTREKRREK